MGGDKNEFPDIIEPLDKELNSKDSGGMGDIVDNDDVWKNIDFNKNSVYAIRMAPYNITLSGNTSLKKIPNIVILCQSCKIFFSII